MCMRLARGVHGPQAVASKVVGVEGMDAMELVELYAMKNSIYGLLSFN